ncbi:MAG: glycine cleavage system protein GcvH [Candidatus Thermoplasmatota archaeon]|nr:glycine cleavage system protein GcvH [Candidatus Thermoplasmatota archaeon]
MVESKIVDGLRYTKTHEWIKVEGNKAKIGITDYAQHTLTDIVFVELPKAGAEVAAGKQLCVVESVKSVSEIYAPVACKVEKANAALESAPEKINKDAYGEGWIAELTLKNPAEASKLMDAKAYEAFLKTQH